MTVLRTARLTLSPVQDADAAFVLELVNDPGWLANIGDRGVRSLDNACVFIRDNLGQNLWLVVRDGGGEPVGMCGIIRREGMDLPDLGYAFLARHSGQGYATEAAAELLGHARGTLGLTRIAGLTKPDNHASQRVLEKIGFTRRGEKTLPKLGVSAYFEV